QPDEDEERWCRKMGLNHHRIPPAKWWSPTGPPPADEAVAKFREIMDNPDNYPVLVHCFAGVHRTGAYCAVYRMEHDRWSNAQATAEMEPYAHDTPDTEWDILGYLEVYRPSWRGPPAPQEVLQKRRPPAKPAGKTARKSAAAEGE